MPVVQSLFGYANHPRRSNRVLKLWAPLLSKHEPCMPLHFIPIIHSIVDEVTPSNLHGDGDG